MKINRIPDNRMRHMQKVAEYMLENADKYNLDKDEMYTLGLLHDIGYLFGAENHEINGENLLKKENYKYANIVGLHGLTPNEFLIKFGKDIPIELILLWEADMSININGENVGFDKRLEDIKSRHGENSRAYITSKERVEWLKENIKK